MNEHKCYHDSPSLSHWWSTCYRPGCGGTVEVHAICGCRGQCGCYLGAWCKQCQTPQLPKTGEAWCPNVRAVKGILKPTRCIAKGCLRSRHASADSKKDYCGKTCARQDGAIK